VIARSLSLFDHRHVGENNLTQLKLLPRNPRHTLQSHIASAWLFADSVGNHCRGYNCPSLSIANLAVLKVLNKILLSKLPYWPFQHFLVASWLISRCLCLCTSEVRYLPTMQVQSQQFVINSLFVSTSS